jgi:RimJ/RimL family protein N-acetyltransferase
MTIREPVCGETVCLAPLAVSSAPRWLEWMHDPGTTRYLYAPGRQPKAPPTLDSLTRWGRSALADPRLMVFSLRDRETQTEIGDARLIPLGGRRGRFSIVIGEGEFRGRGMGGEATALVCRFGFEQMGLRAIELDVDPRNEPAVRAYLRVGFEKRRGNGMRLRAADFAG